MIRPELEQRGASLEVQYDAVAAFIGDTMHVLHRQLFQEALGSVEASASTCEPVAVERLGSGWGGRLGPAIFLPSFAAMGIWPPQPRRCFEARATMC